jgi:hypothetical protein
MRSILANVLFLTGAEVHAMGMLDCIARHGARNNAEVLNARSAQFPRSFSTEDDALLALDVSATLQNAGAEVVDPGATLKHTLSLANTPLLSAAVLDVNLQDEDAYPAARALEGLGVGFVFYTNCEGAGELKPGLTEGVVLRKPAPLEALSRVCKARKLPAPPIS